jgi:hypothetical protein
MFRLLYRNTFMKAKSFLCLVALSLSSVAMAQTKSSTALPGASNQPVGKLETVMLVEEVKAGQKAKTSGAPPSGGQTSASNTFRLEPSGMSFSGPVRVCYKYSANSTNVANHFTAALKSILREIKDKNGKASYEIPRGEPEDDKAKSQMCYTLRYGG